MKKTVLMLFTAALIMSCGNGEAEKKAAEEAAEMEILNNEVNQMDSISEVLEEAAADIEATSDELNNLLNEL